jgi:hypothetical protein
LFPTFVVRSEGQYSYSSIEALFLFWQDGEAKLNLIIDTLISNKMSEASDRNTKDAATLENREFVAPDVIAKKEVKEIVKEEYTVKETFWDELEAFRQRSYQKVQNKKQSFLIYEL